MSATVFMTGLLTGLSLILAIGAQNAFVLRQGLRGEHVFWVCLTCAVSDAILIVLGVGSAGQVLRLLPWLAPAMTLAGAAFLIWYGLRSMRAALASTDALLVGAQGQGTGLARTILSCLAITWLNPHVYLDTVVLLGTISTRFPGQAVAFGFGAITGSFLFFFSLGYGARRLRPIFARPSSWRVLEAGVAMTMWLIAAKLLLGWADGR
ncbi:MAG: LysE/ArgO family amino acid transporter [Paracoccus sp. (in: a-proteobacteria)]|nr:LysE/ArgO family amino acid transporter [Paracoccus sp. (in: a-proteobacteria)]